MNYTISEARLFEVFSRYMEKRFGKPYIDEYYSDVYYMKDGKSIPVGIIGYVHSAGKDMFVPYTEHNQMFNVLKNTFGEAFNDVFLRYLRTNFPEYKIDGIK